MDKFWEIVSYALDLSLLAVLMFVYDVNFVIALAVSFLLGWVVRAIFIKKEKPKTDTFQDSSQIDKAKKPESVKIVD